MMAKESVISGISGRFPKSDNMAEFSKKLFNKVDLTEDNRRWVSDIYGLPRKMGLLKDISKFDNQFFGVHPKQAEILDPQARILLELTYESIVDAGYDPEELRGKNVGVFIGNCNHESDALFCLDSKKITEYSATGWYRSVLSNHISYAFDFKGPSYVLDSGCSSGALALHEAVRAIQNNECESAIVGASNLCLRPETSLQMFRLKVLSADGGCKSFDAAGDGYVRSEAIVVLFLQKYEFARRNYASVIHIKTNTDGFKDEGITFPSATMQERLIKEVYEECNLNPLKVSYVEAHGTGTPVGDPVEIAAIAKIFCRDREFPLPIGSVKSNMGHSEATAGLAGLAKLIIGMENNLIPPNIHFCNPNPNIKPLVEGKVNVVTNPTPFEGDYAALNSFGFGGVNVHAVFKSNANERKPQPITGMPVPQLALYGGRTVEGVQYLFDYLQNEMPPREFFALLHRSVYSSAQKKPFRGYKLLLKDQEVSEIKRLKVKDRPIWYIFSGLGSQWPCMAKELMNLEVFATSIRKSAKILQSYAIDLVEILTNVEINGTKPRGIKEAIISITATQIALVDVLTKIGITPHGIIGHSTGELGCAYADGSLNAEQTILSAYLRGKAIEDTNLSGKYSMATLDMSWSEAIKRCPEDIFPSCHNAESSVSISGPKNSIKNLIGDLEAQTIYASEFNSYGYAFHSKYIVPAAEQLQTSLEMIISNPKIRTSRWISSSYPKQEWNNPSAKIADASYFVHNLVSPVLFHDAVLHIPKEAIIIEIAPHHLFRSLFEGKLLPDAEYIGLMKKNTDNIVHLLSRIGRLYISGVKLDIEKLYPQVLFPVPKSTPMISSLIKWDHSQSWCVAKCVTNENQSQMTVEVDVSSDESPDKYILDHCVDGRCLYPATNYLVLIWKALAKMKGKDIDSLPVTFENVKFHRATVVSKAAPIKFHINIMNCGDFEIMESGITVCTGSIFFEKHVVADTSNRTERNDLLNLPLNQDDIYKELKLRGYECGPKLQYLIGADIEGNKGLIKWNGNWMVYLGTLFQFLILGSSNRILRLVTGIQNIKIDPILQKFVIENSLKDYNSIPVFHNKNTKRTISGGVEVRNVKTAIAPKNHWKQSPLLEEYHFIPYNEVNILSQSDREALEKYINVCSSVAKRILELSGQNEKQISDIMHGFKASDVSSILKFLKNISNNHILLKFLCNIKEIATSQNLKQQAKKLASSYQFERDNDILSQTLLKENPLRTLVDVVLENLPTRKVTIAEITDAPTPLSLRISEFIQRSGVWNINSVIAHSNPDLLDENNINSGNCELSLWDMKSEFTFKGIDLCLIKILNQSSKQLSQILESALTTVTDNGFILLLQRTRLVPAELCLSGIGETIFPVHTESDLEQIFTGLNLQIICKKSDSVASTMYLLRKYVNVSYEDKVIPITENIHEKWVDEVNDTIKIVSMSSDPKRVWLVSEGFSNSGIIGLVNCLRQESGGTSIRCVFISKETPSLPTFSIQNQFYQDIVDKNLIINVFKNNTWGSFKHFTMSKDRKKVETQHAYLDILIRGDFSSFVWVASFPKHFKQVADGNFCHIYYSALNFKDVLLANGQLPVDVTVGEFSLQNYTFGLEFSGRLENGRRVMGLVPAGGLATTIVADPDFLWEVPNDWSLEEASTVPAAYSTAYYSLIVKGKLRKGETVLIHSGSGCVGQAAIAIALSKGCRVFISIGSSEQRTLLKKHFSLLQDTNFCNYGDISFEDHVLIETNGKGIDVVLNSLGKEKSKVILSCLAKNGRFIEIGEHDIFNISLLKRNIIRKNTTFIGINLDVLFEDESYSFQAKKEIGKLVKDGIASGTVKPLISNVFEYDQVEKAFRLLTNSNHIGKIVLKIRDEETEKIVTPTPKRLTALSLTLCNPEKSYVIIGGLGCFELELCQWLVERGARHVVLNSCLGINTGYQKLCFNRWKKRNINIITSELNVIKIDEAKALLKMAGEVKPVAAIFSTGFVYKGKATENQTDQIFEEICDSKISTALNLDAASRECCPELEWFVCFSSLICVHGKAGLSKYAYANSVVERICEERSKMLLPGLAIQWGPIGYKECVSDNIGLDDFLFETSIQSIDSCLTVLDKFLQQKHPVVLSFVPHQISEPISKDALKLDILSTIGKIFGITDLSTINVETSLGELGMDSLMALSIRQSLEQDFGIVLSISKLRRLRIKDIKEFNKKTKTTMISEYQINPSSDSTSKSCTDTIEKIAEPFHLLASKQLVHTEVIVRMNCVRNGIPLFIILSNEDFSGMLTSLAQSINSPVYGIQYTAEAPSQSIEQLAAWYWKHIISLNIGNTIWLAGYSLEVSVAFEMCLQAEHDPQHHPEIHNLIMWDGTPSLRCTQRPTSHNPSDSIKEETQILCLYVSRFVDINSMKFEEELMSLSSHADRVKKSVQKISSIFKHLQEEDLKTALHLYFKKTMLSNNYMPKHKLKKEVTLIKTSDSVDESNTLSETYNLEKVCDGKITVHTVNVTNKNFTLEKGAKEVSDIINSILSH